MSNQRYIALIGASQDLYGPETLKMVAEKMQTVTEHFNAPENGLPCQIRFNGVQISRESIAEFVAAVNNDPQCAGVIIHSFTFSPGQQWVGLKDLNKPVLHLNTWFDAEVPYATIDMDYMNGHQSAHGDIELSKGLDSSGIRRHAIHGYWQDAETLSSIAQWARVALAKAELQSERVLFIGGRMDHVVGTEFSSSALAAKLGVRVVNLDTSKLVAAMQAISNETVDDRVAEYRETYRFDNTAESQLDLVSDAARQELGISELLGQHNANCWTSHFNRLAGLRQLPGLAAQLGMARGQGFGPEGDANVAVAVRLAALMCRDGKSSLGEDYVLGRGVFLDSHMAEVSPAIAARKSVSLQVHPLGIGDSGTVARLVFSAEPMEPATVASLVFVDGAMRLVAGKVSIEAPPEPLPRLPVGHAILRPDLKLPEFRACWQQAGGSHHHALSNIGLGEWELFANATGMQFVGIDKDTTRQKVRASLFQQKVEGPPMLF
jgi:L-arabinose isomerase